MSKPMFVNISATMKSISFACAAANKCWPILVDKPGFRLPALAVASIVVEDSFGNRITNLKSEDLKAWMYSWNLNKVVNASDFVTGFINYCRNTLSAENSAEVIAMVMGEKEKVEAFKREPELSKNERPAESVLMQEKDFIHDKWVISTSNKSKISAVEKTLIKRLGKRIELKIHEVPSGVNAYPNDDEVKRGAINRALKLRELYKDYYTVGLETGIIKDGSNHYAVTWCAIGWNGFAITGSSDWVQLHPSLTKDVSSRERSKIVVNALSSDKDIFQYTTGSLMSRFYSFIQAFDSCLLIVPKYLEEKQVQKAIEPREEIKIKTIDDMLAESVEEKTDYEEIIKRIDTNRPEPADEEVRMWEARPYHHLEHPELKELVSKHIHDPTSKTAMREVANWLLSYLYNCGVIIRRWYLHYPDWSPESMVYHMIQNYGDGAPKWAYFYGFMLKFHGTPKEEFFINFLCDTQPEFKRIIQGSTDFRLFEGAKPWFHDIMFKLPSTAVSDLCGDGLKEEVSYTQSGEPHAPTFEAVGRFDVTNSVVKYNDNSYQKTTLIITSGQGNTKAEAKKQCEYWFLVTLCTYRFNNIVLTLCA